MMGKKVEHVDGESRVDRVSKIDHVDYNTLDRAKRAFIEAGKRTTKFASRFGFIPDERFGASANVFSLNLKPFLQAGNDQLHITLLPEGLGTADDARPADLSAEEAREFWHNIGIKTVAVMTNDAASSGMQTILISLYLPSSNPEIVFSEDFMSGFLDGFVQGCRRVGCVYFSGETPQLKNKIVEGKLDIAGALFALVPPGREPIDSTRLKSGDTIVFVQSSGPHENGFTTLRKIGEELPSGYRTKLPSGMEYWRALNAPSVLYTPLIQDLLAAGIRPSNVENITGHGWQKMMRPKQNLCYRIQQMLPIPEVFSFVEQQAQIPKEQLFGIFNCGVGMAICLAERGEADEVVQRAKALGLQSCVAGRVEESDARRVVIEPLGITLSGEEFQLSK